MKQQEQILNHRVVAFQEGIRQIGKRLHGIDVCLIGKDNVQRDEIQTLREEIGELEGYIDWLVTR